MANTFERIAAQVLTSSAASVTFSSIPQTYTDLVLRASIRVNNGSNSKPIGLAFNGTNTSNTNYSYRMLVGQGSAGATSNWGNSTDTVQGGEINDAVSAANTFSSVEFYIPNYTVAQNRQVSFFTAQEDNVASYAFITAGAGLYRNTTAITSLTIRQPTGYSAYSFVAGCSFHLYGIKNT